MRLNSYRQRIPTDGRKTGNKTTTIFSFQYYSSVGTGGLLGACMHLTTWV